MAVPKDSGDVSNTTYAAISEGSVTVKSNPDLDLSKQTALKRSKQAAHQILERIFSEDKVSEVQDKLLVQQILSSEVPKAIGDYARDKQIEANAILSKANEELDPAVKKALLAEAMLIHQNWGEGGKYRVSYAYIIRGIEWKFYLGLPGRWQQL